MLSHSIPLASPAQPFRIYASITKPGIIFGNLIAVIGGYFLGTQGTWNLSTFLPTLLGISCVIGSASAFNNVIDRDIDPLMERTKNRVLANGSLLPAPALIFATFLGLLGHAILAWFANPLSAFVAFLGWFAYVVLYSLATKRSTVHGTLVGSISGAIPPLVGYTAATNSIALPAILLVLGMCFWQMPHSYAIGIFRRMDFEAAHIPLLPLLTSEKRTQFAMIAYTVLFCLTILSLSLFGFTGSGFAWFMGITSGAWLVLTVAGLWSKNQVRWAKQVFAGSILIVTFLSLALVFDAKPILF